MIKWHHSSDRPPPLGTVVICAVRLPEIDCPDEYFSGADYLLFSGLYTFTHDGLQPESNAPQIRHNDYWYCLETDLMSHLRVQIALRTNGHGVGAE